MSGFVTGTNRGGATIKSGFFMKGFGIEIKNNLLEPKHVQKMGTAVWLYMWLIDKTTSISEDEVGTILGGKPVKFDEVQAELGISQNTYTSWIKKLTAYPYISAQRTPRGTIFKVYKTHKRFSSIVTENSDSQKTVIHKNVKSDSQKSRNLYIDNNKDSNNKERNILKKEITENDLEEIATKYSVPLTFVKLQKEKMENWQLSKGKLYKDKKAALRNWVLKAAEDRIERSQKNARYGYTDLSKV